jgi:hypothetical protein
MQQMTESESHLKRTQEDSRPLCGKDACDLAEG